MGPSLRSVLIPVLTRPQERPQPATRSQRPYLRNRLVERARLGRIDVLVLGRVDALGRIGNEHQIPAIAHPLAVDLGDAPVFPHELSSPGEQVDGRRRQCSWADLPHAVDLAKGLERER